MTAALLSTVSRARAGAASGLLNAIRRAGAAIGVALFGALVRGDMIGGLRMAAITSAVLLAAAGVAALFGVRPVGAVGRVPVGAVKIRAN